MARGHSGNAFSTDFTSLFSGIAPEPAKTVEKKEEKTSSPKKPKKAENKDNQPVKPASTKVEKKVEVTNPSPVIKETAPEVKTTQEKELTQATSKQNLNEAAPAEKETTKIEVVNTTIDDKTENTSTDVTNDIVEPEIETITVSSIPETKDASTSIVEEPAKQSEDNKSSESKPKTQIIEKAVEEVNLPKESNTTVTKVKNPKSIIAAQNDEVYMNVFMVSQEERDYLKFRSTELEMSTSQFFWSLIEADGEKIKNRSIDINDQAHADFKLLKMPVNTSVKVKTEQKALIKKYSVRHRLSVQRYCAFIIHQAILNDDEWY